MTAALIPAFNEEKTIEEAIRGCKRFADGVVVLDEGSTDGTAEIAGWYEVVLLKRERNESKGEALRECVLCDCAPGPRCPTMDPKSIMLLTF